MPLFKFNKDAFSALSMYPFDPDAEWANLGETQLDEMAEEAVACGDEDYQANYSALMMFAALAGGDEVDTGELLLVKVGIGGVFRDCYGPKVCRNDETGELCVKIGNSLIPASAGDGKVLCGDLAGRVMASTKERQDKSTYMVASIMFRQDGGTDTYEIPCSLDPEMQIDPGTFLMYIDTGEDIAPYFRSAKSGGSKRLKDLEVGRYSVVEIAVNEKGSVSLILDDGTKLYATGNSEAVGSKAHKVCSPSNPFTLDITDKDEYSPGKISVTHSLKRTGAMGRSDMKKKRMAKAIEEKVSAPVRAKATPKRAAVKEEKSPVKQVDAPVEDDDYNEIPF